MTEDPPGPTPLDTRLLLEAASTVASDLSLDRVLSNIVGIAGRLLGARYAALGVLNPGSGPRLRTFVHHGVSDDVVATIGELPTGHGLLGLIIDRPAPLRLHDIAAHPASYGFPPHHPPMRSFLGVPIRVRGRVFGNLYLTEKDGSADFTEEDVEVAVALASSAGVAIENAELYEESEHRQRWLAASAEITAGLVGSRDPRSSLEMIAERARATASADFAWIVAGAGPEDLEVHAVSGFDPAMAEVVRAAPLSGTLTQRVVRTGRAAVSAHLAGDVRAQLPAVEGWPEIGATVVVPLSTAAGGCGALALAWAADRGVDVDRIDTSLPAGFAEQAALALEVGRGRDDRERVALLEDRDRIARDLHDLVIQRLFAVGLGLQGAARAVVDAEVAARIERAVDDLDATIRDVRRTIFDLASDGEAPDLQSEVEQIVGRAGTTLKLRPTLVLDGPVRSAVPAEVAPDLLAVLAEALSNASRHADATAVEVRLAVDGASVRLEVADDGTGLPVDRHESGLGYMRDRAHRHDGTLTVGSGLGGRGTGLVWTVPLLAGGGGPGP